MKRSEFLRKHHCSPMCAEDAADMAELAGVIWEPEEDGVIWEARWVNPQGLEERHQIRVDGSWWVDGVKWPVENEGPELAELVRRLLAERIQGGSEGGAGTPRVGKIAWSHQDDPEHFGVVLPCGDPDCRQPNCPTAQTSTVREHVTDGSPCWCEPKTESPWQSTEGPWRSPWHDEVERRLKALEDLVSIMAASLAQSEMSRINELAAGKEAHEKYRDRMRKPDETT